MARTIARGRTDEERLGIYTYFMGDKTNVNPTPDTVTNIVIKIKKRLVNGIRKLGTNLDNSDKSTREDHGQYIPYLSDPESGAYSLFSLISILTLPSFVLLCTNSFIPRINLAFIFRPSGWTPLMYMYK